MLQHGHNPPDRHGDDPVWERTDAAMKALARTIAELQGLRDALCEEKRRITEEDT